MLGLNPSLRSWQWTAFGKHPSFSDFISVGQLFSVARSFSDLIDKGSAANIFQKKEINNLCAWRFWAKGGGTDEIVCGLLRESYDCFGRPYPLVLIGTGFLAGWDKYWELLPYSCQSTWSRLEYISTGRFRSVAHLGEEMLTIRPPVSEWMEYSESASSPVDGPSDFLARKGDGGNLRQHDDDSFLFSLEVRESNLNNPFGENNLIAHCHRNIKEQWGRIPNSVFIGGTIVSSYVAFYFRPLSPLDFATICSPP